MSSPNPLVDKIENDPELAEALATQVVEGDLYVVDMLVRIALKADLTARDTESGELLYTEDERKAINDLISWANGDEDDED